MTVSAEDRPEKEFNIGNLSEFICEKAREMLFSCNNPQPENVFEIWKMQTGKLTKWLLRFVHKRRILCYFGINPSTIGMQKQDKGLYER